MRSSRRILLIIIPVLGLTLWLTAQNKREPVAAEDLEVIGINDTSLHKVYELDLKKRSNVRIKLPRPASSMVVEWLFQPEDDAHVVFSDGMDVQIAEEGSDNGGKRLFSRLIIPEDSITSFQLKAGKNEGKIKIHALFVPEWSGDDRPREVLAKAKLLCMEPQWIEQSDWRKGLADPKPNPISTQVNHCVVHHSAVASSDTDYVKRIRNIYVFHTETRGWDDIGYNFLVAPNGTLFAVRDPQGNGDQDNVMGAHYCAKNTGTMGVCMMGDYTDTTISDTAESTLRHLLVWKLYKEGLTTLDSFIHPKEVGEYLKTVVGHRDGCATACPGDKFYPTMGDLRADVQSELDRCIAASVAKVSGTRIVAFPNPCIDFLSVRGIDLTQERISITGLNGKALEPPVVLGPSRLDFRDYPMGLYWLQIGEHKALKILKVNR